MNYIELTSPCGLDCFNCPAYLANENLEIRKVISSKYNLSLDESSCKGCRNSHGIISFQGDTSPCAVYSCTKRVNVTFCNECPDFPCDHLHPYADQASNRPHNTKIFNLCLIKKMGVEKWALEKAAGVKKNYFNGKLKMHKSDEE